ncbi:hypothetical protein C8J56DRAFT_1129676 [Mycena floridula]|nr:hypothetical protein C8J56DRAFT_1129676 [Mycena floridula]
MPHTDENHNPNPNPNPYSLRSANWKSSRLRNAPPSLAVTPNPTHYRQITHQRDGWTCLEATEDQAHRGQAPSDDPPPYTPRIHRHNARPVHPPPRAEESEDSDDDAPINLRVEVPKRTNVISASVSLETIFLPSTTSFNDAFSRICTVMELDVQTAKIGYKYDKDLKRDPPHALNTSADWEDCVSKGKTQMASARTRVVTCKIENLNPPAIVASTSISKKRKHGALDDDPSDESKTAQRTALYRELVATLKCQKHEGRYCWVGSDGECKQVDSYHRDLWITAILMGHASIGRPPENIIFQDFFMNKRPRKARVSPESKAASNQPIIHITVNNPAPSNPASSLPVLKDSARVNIDLSPHASSSETPIEIDESPNRYPEVSTILSEIEASGRFEALSVGVPFWTFTSALRDDFEIVTVDQAIIPDRNFYVDAVGMTPDLAECLISMSRAAVRDVKGKGKA